MKKSALILPTHFLDRLPVRVSTQCIREKTDLHFHNHTQLIFLLSGTLHHTIAEKEYIQERDSCAILLPYTEHIIDLTKSEDTPVVVFISFYDSFLTERGYSFFPYGKQLARFEQYAIPQICTFSEQNREKVRALVYDTLDEFSKQDKMSFDRIAGLCAEFLRTVCSDSAKKCDFQLVSERASGIKRAVKYIEKNYAQKLTIDMLCPIAGMSRSTFTINFKNITGLTFLQYLLSCRLTAARALLLRKYHQKHTLDDVAKKVGLGDRTNLTRVFRKSLGISPSQFCIEHLCNAPKEHSTHTNLEWMESLSVLDD